jgi:hypothetical protein
MDCRFGYNHFGVGCGFGNIHLGLGCIWVCCIGLDVAFSYFLLGCLDFGYLFHYFGVGGSWVVLEGGFGYLFLHFGVGCNGDVLEGGSGYLFFHFVLVCNWNVLEGGFDYLFPHFGVGGSRSVLEGGFEYSFLHFGVGCWGILEGGFGIWQAFWSFLGVFRVPLGVNKAYLMLSSQLGLKRILLGVLLFVARYLEFL